MSDQLDSDLAAGRRFERALFWRALLIVAFIVAVITARAIWG